MEQQYWTTAIQPTGNRWIESCKGGSTISVKKKEEAVGSRLEWVVGSQTTTATEFLGLYSNGKISRFSSTPTDEPVTVSEGQVSSRPLVAQGDPLMPILSPSTGSIHSNAIPISSLNGTLYVDSSQRLQFQKMDGSTVAIEGDITDALIDAHITYSPTNDMWALYTFSTNQRYDHGILGDLFEGYHLTVLKVVDGTLQVINDIVLQDNDNIVFEDLSPVWTDVDQDGVDDLLTTIAARTQGAAMRVYVMNADGTVKGEVQSDYIGTGNRWLSKIAHAPTGPNGEWEIIDCRTPHIGGIVRYYHYDGTSSRLAEVTRVSSQSYTSHLINSRNIDQALVADLNGDGIPELVIQNQRRTKIVGLQRTTNGVEEVWSVPLDAAIHSNFAISCGAQKYGAAQLVFGTVNNEVYTVSFTTNGTMAMDDTMGMNGTIDLGDPVVAGCCPSCMTQLNGILSLFLVIYCLWL